MEIIDITKDKVEYFNKQDSTLMIHQESSQNPSSPQPSTTTASPPSSPTHEFSFTVSLHHHPQPPIAIDLSPADDIFFQGHLLPLHFPISSPRSSTNSMDSYTLPMNLLYDDQSNPTGNTSFHCHHQTTFSEYEPNINMTTTTQNHPSKSSSSSKSFSIFNIPKWKKRCDAEREIRDEDEQCQSNKETNNKKLKLDHLGQLIKRYMKMVKPALWSFQKPSRRPNREFKHQSYSYPGNSKHDRWEKKSRGRFSAPASMRTSPANSGILAVASSSGSVSPSSASSTYNKSMTSESSMEELHAAIQAAIAHCKNSIAMDMDTKI